MSRARAGPTCMPPRAKPPRPPKLATPEAFPFPVRTRSEHELVTRLERSQAKNFALASSPYASEAAKLAVPPAFRARRPSRPHPPGVRGARADGVPDLITRRRTQRAAAARPLLAVSGRVRAMDRDNVGTIRSIDDTAGLAAVTFTSAAGRNATRNLSWSDLKPIDHPNAEPIPAAAQYWLAARRTELVDSDQAWGRPSPPTACLRPPTSRPATPSRSAQLDSQTSSPPNHLTGSSGGSVHARRTKPARQPGTTPSPASPPGATGTTHPTTRQASAPNQ